ncbi:MAG: chalcone isomerase family protein [Candidatus Thiodiazotropha sp. (ex Lucina aurantia)]|nr:chalcone isomerase family protein [Candidatus Thiodiazotropha sp. (ex Lucina pensylvanica)]MBT3025001.1 chalcone isomerase family protein [Candidatus Thiodiazotropha taylori]MBT3050025.1 chalcone isomerase family protein [Candidatus Thiodiazotropha sp. (ex Codakia orbicularis)]MBV2101407.1 chalcone isomerase family protein [Candidatus Thiodiazotropha sp. (ex Lucina aurantia)]MBT3030210.1 chalcone isomerase family protein [Candidatus Thiodiazotropha sp. (ex Lucina pensylvanica)]
MMRQIVITCLLMTCMMTIQAREIAGISLPEQIVREADNATLVLNGAGIRKKVFFKIYLASLYLQQSTSDIAEVIDVDRPARVQMQILYSEIEKEKFVEGWNDGFSANLSPEKLQAVGDRLDQFNAMFQTLQKGDLISLDYMPGKGTVVTIKGVEKGVIPGGDFYQALLMVWLGDSPISKSLKQELLGSD